MRLWRCLPAGEVDKRVSMYVCHVYTWTVHVCAPRGLSVIWPSAAEQSPSVWTSFWDSDGSLIRTLSHSDGNLHNRSINRHAGVDIDQVTIVPDHQLESKLWWVKDLDCGVLGIRTVACSGSGLSHVRDQDCGVFRIRTVACSGSGL